jgi:glyoxylase-like metal-dependent hydrolase (beta-lactamase superfamily II)
VFLQLFDPESSTWTYLLGDDSGREAVLIDPVLPQLERDLALLAAHGLRLVCSVDTHVHADHVTGAGALKAATGAPTAVGADCLADGYDRALFDGDTVAFGRERLEAISTPGHTPGSTCFLWHDGPARRLFTGDTLLIGGCGRTDFQGGSARQLWDSVTRRLFSLPDDTVVLPGHDYHGRRDSLIGAERLDNPRFAGHTLESFVAQMQALQLPPPRMIEAAVPANKLAGAGVQVARLVHGL